MEELPFLSSSQSGQDTLYLTGCDSTIGTTKFEKNISHLNSLTAYTTVTVHYIALQSLIMDIRFNLEADK